MNEPTVVIGDKVFKLIHSGDYKVGDLFFTLNSESPAQRFGGTWEKLTADAYLKIVTSGASGTGGTNLSHKIPIESMPSHKHAIKNFQSSQYFMAGDGGDNAFKNTNTPLSGLSYTDVMEYAGGGQPYYPYYYGVYAWKRVA